MLEFASTPSNSSYDHHYYYYYYYSITYIIVLVLFWLRRSILISFSFLLSVQIWVRERHRAELFSYLIKIMMMKVRHWCSCCWVSQMPWTVFGASDRWKRRITRDEQYLECIKQCTRELFIRESQWGCTVECQYTTPTITRVHPSERKILSSLPYSTLPANTGRTQTDWKFKAKLFLAATPKQE